MTTSHSQPLIGATEEDVKLPLQQMTYAAAIRHVLQEEMVARQHTQHKATACLLLPGCQCIAFDPSVLQAAEDRDRADERLPRRMGICLADRKICAQDGQQELPQFIVFQNLALCAIKTENFLHKFSVR